MKSLDSLRRKAESLVLNDPSWDKAFPPQPWDEADLEEIAYITSAFRLSDEVVNDDPWADWLDSWKFYLSQK